MNNPTDTELLDWLQAHQESLYTVRDMPVRVDTSGWPTCTQKFLGWSVGSRRDECLDIREAIRRAMNNEKEII